MAFPPSYSDLGKSARDVFNKGYGFGMVKLELKTKSSSGVEFAATGSSNTDTGKASGSLETKYKIKDYGLTFTQKWNTDNTLGTEVSMEDQVRSRYPENVSAAGMRQYSLEQKTLKSESCTKLSEVLKRKKFCIFAERTG
uniref:Non-selective voltage-gated ion channel VDAC3 n=1 Tax=Strix occidentalis caurina TaxID=311401 RepID=A0A8D0EUG0_STROC